MIKSLIKLFGGGGNSDSQAPSGKDAGEIKDLENFVDYIVRALVDSPEDVAVHSEVGEEANIIKISCKKEDIGKIVGKKGKTIMAIRSLVSGAAGRLQKKVAVEVLD